MSECIHSPLCTNECPCDYYEERREEEYTKIVPDFKGNAIVYGHCVRCGQPIQYPTDRVYNGCPYCFARIIYKEDI